MGVRVAALAELLDRQHITQRQLANILGIHASIVSLWVLGKRGIPRKHMEQIEALVGQERLHARLPIYRSWVANPYDGPELQAPEFSPEIVRVEPVAVTYTDDPEYSPLVWNGRSQYNTPPALSAPYEAVCWAAHHSSGVCHLTEAQARLVRLAGLRRRCGVCGSRLALEPMDVGRIGGGIQHRARVSWAG